MKMYEEGEIGPTSKESTARYGRLRLYDREGKAISTIYRITSSGIDILSPSANTEIKVGGLSVTITGQDVKPGSLDYRTFRLMFQNKDIQDLESRTD